MLASGIPAELEKVIIDQLARGCNPDDIFLEVCEKTGLSWEEAEKEVARISLEYDKVIHRRRFPTTTAVAFITFCGGLLLTGYAIYSIYPILTGDAGIPKDLTSHFMPIIENGVDPVSALKLVVFSYFALLLSLLLNPFSMLIIGIAMILGSLVGMKNAWSGILG